jgi:hypothetical protein
MILCMIDELGTQINDITTNRGLKKTIKTA